MFVQIQGCNDGHEWRVRARRVWHNAAPVRVEIVESEDGSDPPDLEQVDAAGKVVGSRPDPLRIGRKSLAELKADNCIRVMSDDDTQSEQAGLALAEVKKLAAQHAAKAADLTVELAMVMDENVLLVSQVAALKAENAALTAKVASLEAPPAAAAPEENVSAPKPAKGSKT